MSMENSSAGGQQRQLIELALQGGGSGALTCVLERLLERPCLTIEALRRRTMVALPSIGLPAVAGRSIPARVRSPWASPMRAFKLR